MRLKINDTVKIIGGVGFDHWSKSASCLGKIATITSDGSELYLLNNNQWEINFKKEWLELVENNHEVPIKGTNVPIKGTDARGGEQIMTNEFTPGDTVTLNELEGSCFTGDYVVEACDCGCVESIKVTNGADMCHCRQTWVRVKKAMDSTIRLTKEQELAFSKEQKALYKTGIVDSNGNNNLGAALRALMRVNYKALVAQAESDIKEQEDAAKAVQGK